MKRFFKILGWICLGIFLQFKFNVLYGIVFLENLNFHDRTYYVKMKMIPTPGKVSLLQTETIVHHSLGPDYFAQVYIPEEYKVLNHEPYKGAETLSGYQTYKMDMERHYRDVLDSKDFIVVPANPEKEQIPPTPIVVHFENLKQRLHTDKTYMISTTNGTTRLEGPELVEATYPQKWGM